MFLFLCIALGVFTYHVGLQIGMGDSLANAFGWLLGLLCLIFGESVSKSIFSHWGAHIEYKKEKTRLIIEQRKQLVQEAKEQKRTLAEQKKQVKLQNENASEHCAEKEIGQSEKFSFFKNKTNK